MAAVPYSRPPLSWDYVRVSGRVAYLDTSAFLKLIVAEDESEALRSRLRRWPDRASATLLRTETVRALRRSGNEHLVGKPAACSEPSTSFA